MSDAVAWATTPRPSRCPSLTRPSSAHAGSPRPGQRQRTGRARPPRATAERSTPCAAKDRPRLAGDRFAPRFKTFEILWRAVASPVRGEDAKELIGPRAAADARLRTSRGSDGHAPSLLPNPRRIKTTQERHATGKHQDHRARGKDHAQCWSRTKAYGGRSDVPFPVLATKSLATRESEQSAPAAGSPPTSDPSSKRAGVVTG